MKRACAFSAVLFAALALPPAALAAELPEWEAGLGATVLSVPDYRGADQGKVYILPVPYLIYRGEALKVDRGSVRGIFFTSERVEVDTSFNGSPPARSGQNGARQGMPDLDSVLEFGPSVKLTLAETPDAFFKGQLQLPLRAVIASDFSYFRYTGFIFNPRLNFDWGRARPDRRWSAGFALGPVFGDTRNYRYYYEVPLLYASSARPAYTPHGGYGGTQLALSASGRTGNIWVGAFARIDSLHGARFEDSPLVKTRWSFTAGLALSWVFGASDVMVRTDEW
jgi:outer membrane scaffolding protein for murein synthesis (MipA/OmpV family)